MKKLAVALLLPSVAFADQITIPDVRTGDVADPVYVNTLKAESN